MEIMAKLVGKHEIVTSLQDVQKQQSYIETLLTSSSNSTNIDIIESQLSAVETTLKAISQSNQNERKKIAIEHRQALESQGSSQLIKQRLISLAEKQRTLLACFTRQKELSTQLHALKSTISQRSSTVSLIDLTASTVEPSRSIPQPPLTAKPGDLKAVVSNKEKGHTTTKPHGSETPTTIKQQSSNMVKPVSAVQYAVSSRPLPISGPSSADLAQPVPLDTLIQCNLIRPGKNCITAVLMVGIVLTFNLRH